MWGRTVCAAAALLLLTNGASLGDGPLADPADARLYLRSYAATLARGGARRPVQLRLLLRRHPELVPAPLVEPGRLAALLAGWQAAAPPLAPADELDGLVRELVQAAVDRTTATASPADGPVPGVRTKKGIVSITRTDTHTSYIIQPDRQPLHLPARFASTTTAASAVRRSPSAASDHQPDTDWLPTNSPALIGSEPGSGDGPGDAAAAVGTGKKAALGGQLKDERAIVTDAEHVSAVRQSSQDVTAWSDLPPVTQPAVDVHSAGGVGPGETDTPAADADDGAAAVTVSTTGSRDATAATLSPVTVVVAASAGPDAAVTAESTTPAAATDDREAMGDEPVISAELQHFLMRFERLQRERELAREVERQGTSASIGDIGWAAAEVAAPPLSGGLTLAGLEAAEGTSATAETTDGLGEPVSTTDAPLTRYPTDPWDLFNGMFDKEGAERKTSAAETTTTAAGDVLARRPAPWLGGMGSLAELLLDAVHRGGGAAPQRERTDPAAAERPSTESVGVVDALSGFPLLPPPPPPAGSTLSHRAGVLLPPDGDRLPSQLGHRLLAARLPSRPWLGARRPSLERRIGPFYDAGSNPLLAGIEDVAQKQRVHRFTTLDLKRINSIGGRRPLVTIRLPEPPPSLAAYETSPSQPPPQPQPQPQPPPQPPPTRWLRPPAAGRGTDRPTDVAASADQVAVDSSDAPLLVHLTTTESGLETLGAIVSSVVDAADRELPSLEHHQVRPTEPGLRELAGLIGRSRSAAGTSTSTSATNTSESPSYKSPSPVGVESAGSAAPRLNTRDIGVILAGTTCGVLVLCVALVAATTRCRRGDRLYPLLSRLMRPHYGYRVPSRSTSSPSTPTALPPPPPSPPSLPLPQHAPGTHRLGSWFNGRSETLGSEMFCGKLALPEPYASQEAAPAVRPVRPVRPPRPPRPHGYHLHQLAAGLTDQLMSSSSSGASVPNTSGCDETPEAHVAAPGRSYVFGGLLSRPEPTPTPAAPRRRGRSQTRAVSSRSRSCSGERRRASLSEAHSPQRRRGGRGHASPDYRRRRRSAADGVPGRQPSPTDSSGVEWSSNDERLI